MKIKKRTKLSLILIVSFFLFHGCAKQEQNELVGVWDLEYVTFITSDTTETEKYDEILMFSKNYYSNFQASISKKDWINSHAGTYRISGDTCYSSIQFANQPQLKGVQGYGIFVIRNDTLSLTIPPQHGDTSTSIWVYSKLE